MIRRDFQPRLIARAVVIVMSWGIAWGVGWLIGSNVAFYLVGALGTVVGIQGILREIRFQKNYKPDQIPPYVELAHPAMNRVVVTFSVRLDYE